MLTEEFWPALDERNRMSPKPEHPHNSFWKSMDSLGTFKGTACIVFGPTAGPLLFFPHPLPPYHGCALVTSFNMEFPYTKGFWEFMLFTRDNAGKWMMWFKVGVMCISPHLPSLSGSVEMGQQSRSSIPYTPWKVENYCTTRDFWVWMPVGKFSLMSQHYSAWMKQQSPASNLSIRYVVKASLWHRRAGWGSHTSSLFDWSWAGTKAEAGFARRDLEWKEPRFGVHVLLFRNASSQVEMVM